MANREELPVIRAARAGQASAQLLLGRRYLFGGAGLPKSLPTALYWLDRAAEQNEQDAWLLIGGHVPFETVQKAPHPERLYVWYERAFDAGVAQAGLVLAKLVLRRSRDAVSDPVRNKALHALQIAADAGIAEAQWLMAQQVAAGDVGQKISGSYQGKGHDVMLEWVVRAARSGVNEAQYALADHAWAKADSALFLQAALPLATRLLAKERNGLRASQRDLHLVLRCAQVLLSEGSNNDADLKRLLEFAADAGAGRAQFMLGLWYARMDAEGRRNCALRGQANYKKATRCLSQVAERGVTQAWYVLSKIYASPECSRHSLEDARMALRRAAEAGHGVAQFEIGLACWRARRTRESGDVEALAWLQKARANGVQEAASRLDKITARIRPAPWAKAAVSRLTAEFTDMHPLLAARLELAAAFGLSRCEAMLINLQEADQGHCLVVDVRRQHPRSRRRLFLVQSAQERQLLDRLGAVFERHQEEPEGLEGSYRRRLYRLKRLLTG